MSKSGHNPTATAEQSSTTSDERANYNCPTCGRPTLARAPGEVIR